MRILISVIILIILIFIGNIANFIINSIDRMVTLRKEKLLKSYGFYKSKNGQYWKYENSIIVPDIFWNEVKYSSYKKLKDLIEKDRLGLIKDKKR